MKAALNIGKSVIVKDMYLDPSSTHTHTHGATGTLDGPLTGDTLNG